ncbi:TadE/TadG family type IV pilus assembly protein [Oceanomicrobium pacificus]|uniref:Pilus assembly protein n=1 Tax=Oceanomicrobium pacificus TaxID=2692916 RepID=A0A6B0TT66_9RHOB|nr:TadE/TadG family type IV pilus assembly protein [Oceanomicrobium pacificus]MXU64995.1 pilus assembly protein [Oceanomicrobium pacificus]
MRQILPRLTGHLRHFWSDSSGNATVEFVIIAPVLFSTVLSIFESGWLMTKYMMLDRGVDMAVRDVRLVKNPTMSHDDLKDDICNYAKIFKDCSRTLVLELVPLDLNAAYPGNEPNCFDRTEEIEPKKEFSTGAHEEIMFVRACVVTDPIFPGLGIGLQLEKDNTGGYRMVSFGAFMNEPA